MINTIGYENAELSDLVATLLDVGVNILVDVRDRAQSRKKGFSKTALSQALKVVGIEYIHLKELGDPKEGREAARRGQWDRFDKIYNNVLATKKAREAIAYLEELSSVKSLCLLCYERDHKTCHRKYITDKIESRTGIKARHLGVRKFDRAA